MMFEAGTLQRAAKPKKVVPSAWDTMKHDAVTGAIDGAAGSVVVDKITSRMKTDKGAGALKIAKGSVNDIAFLLNKENRGNTGRASLVGAGIGAVSTGLIGAAVAAVNRRRAANANRREEERQVPVALERGMILDGCIELARGDVLLRRMAQSGGKVKMDLEDSKSIVGAMKKDATMYHSKPRGSFMQNARDHLASQIRQQRKDTTAWDFKPGAAAELAKKQSRMKHPKLHAAMDKAGAAANQIKAGIGQASEGAISKLRRARNAVFAPEPRLAYEYSAKRAVIEFDSLVGDFLEFRDRREPVVPIREYTLRDRIRDEDLDRGYRNSRNAAVMGALAGVAIPGKLSRLKRAAIGAGSGIAGVGAVRAVTSKDEMGQRSWEAQRAEGWPAKLALGAAAGGAVIRGTGIKKKLAEAVKKATTIK